MALALASVQVHIDDSQVTSYGVMDPVQSTGLQTVAADADVKSMVRVSPSYSSVQEKRVEGTFYPQAEDRHVYSIKRHEPIILTKGRAKSRKRTTSTINGMGPQLDVRSALNGMTVAEVQEARFAGFWHADYNHDEFMRNGTEGYAAGAAVHHGMVSYVNTGADPLYAGDMFCMAPPDIYVMATPNGNRLLPKVHIVGTPQTKFTMVPKKLHRGNFAKHYADWVEVNWDNWKLEADESNRNTFTDPAETLWPVHQRPEEYKQFIEHMKGVIRRARGPARAPGKHSEAGGGTGTFAMMPPQASGDSKTQAQKRAETKRQKATEAAAAAGASDAGSSSSAASSGGGSSSGGGVSLLGLSGLSLLPLPPSEEDAKRRSEDRFAFPEVQHGAEPLFISMSKSLVWMVTKFFTGPMSRANGIVLNNSPVGAQLDMLLLCTG